jgi:hypothetical protein
VARKCVVCGDPRVAEIDAALLEDRGYREIAERFGTSKSALFRHRASHLPATLLKAKDAAAMVAGDTLMEQVEELKSMARRLGKKAEDAGDYRGALAAVRELVRIVDLIAKLTGQIGGDPGGPGSPTRASITINFPVMSEADREAVNNAPTIDLPPMARRLLTRPSDGHPR